jgi:hypothetical protein
MFNWDRRVGLFAASMLDLDNLIRMRLRLHMAGNSIGIIRAFYRLGVRYVRFCYSISLSSSIY